MSEGWIKVYREDLEMFGNERKNLISELLYLLLDADEDSTVTINEESANREHLKQLVQLGFIDLYIKRNFRGRRILLAIIRPSELYELGTDAKVDLPIASAYYTNRNRSDLGYQKFRKKVLKRDKYSCRLCGSTEDLEVHHIKEYVNYPDLRTDVKNGITLCHSCHRKQHTKRVRYNGNL